MRLAVREVTIRPRVIFCLLIIASIGCGFLVQQVIDSGLSLMSSTTGGMISFIAGPSNAILLAFIGGLPAVSVAFLTIYQEGRIEARRTLRRIWIGPVVTAAILGCVLLIFWPAAIYSILILVIFSGVGGAMLFEAAGIIAVVSTKQVRRTPEKRDGKPELLLPK